ncbi:MAG: hypothetical protein AAF532_17320 [Planctomycetota bacterium]
MTRYPTDAEIFARVSPIELARSWGVRFTERTNGAWHECRALDRDDERPSAGVHAETGAYHDLGPGDGCRFWDIAVRLGVFSAWEDARDDVARSVGLLTDDDPRWNPTRPAPPAPRPEKNEPASKRRPAPVFPTAEAAANDLLRFLRSHGGRERTKGFAPDDGPPKVYRYPGAGGEEIGAVCRIDGTKGDGTRSKSIAHLRRDPAGWTRRAMTPPRPLYRLPELIASADTVRGDRIVLVVEGEKAADAVATLIDDLAGCGITPAIAVTTNPGGASAVTKADWSPLAGRRVLVWPDHDEAGRKWRDGVTAILAGLDPPARVKWIDPVRLWPDMPDKGDAFDWTEARDAVPAEDLIDAVIGARVTPPHGGPA